MLIARVLVPLMLALAVSCIPYKPSPLMVLDRPIRACQIPIQLIPIIEPGEPALPLEEAMAFWNRAIQYDIFTLEEAPTKVIVVWESALDESSYLGVAKIPQPDACYTIAGVFLRLDPEALYTRVYTVMVHELGHILGLSHHPSPEYIMYRTVPKDPPKRRVAPSEIYLIRRLLPMEKSNAD